MLGAAASLVGDHCHVVTATTEYLSPSHRVPFVWSSPIWFPIVVGAATVALAELRLHLPSVRTKVGGRYGLGGIAAVMGTYSLTALVHTAPVMVATVLITALAAIIWSVLGDRFALVCATTAAIIGPAAEAVLAASGAIRYAPGSDGLFGVAPWLPPLYFSFGVVAALLGEIAATRPCKEFTGPG